MTPEIADHEYETFVELAQSHGVVRARQRLSRWPEDVLDAVQEEYQRRVDAIQHGEPPHVVAALNPESWYAGPLSDDLHWPALKQYLSEHLDWPSERIEVLDHASSKVVQSTPRPADAAWRGRGLVVGYVQSGKTTNFTAVIAKAADRGYNLVIVLSGIHNGLRRQTQQRLDEQLCGLHHGSWVSLTNEDRDFHTQTMNLESLITDGGDRKAVRNLSSSLRHGLAICSG